VPVLDALLSMQVKAQDVVLVQNDDVVRCVLEPVSEILNSATVLCEPFKALVFNTQTASDTVSWSGWTFVPTFTAKEIKPLLAVKE